MQARARASERAMTQERSLLAILVVAMAAAPSIAAAGPPAAKLTIEAVDVHGLGPGHVAVHVRNTATDERGFKLRTVRRDTGKGFATGGTVEGQKVAREIVAIRWPAACAPAPI